MLLLCLLMNTCANIVNSFKKIASLFLNQQTIRLEIIKNKFIDLTLKPRKTTK